MVSLAMGSGNAISIHDVIHPDTQPQASSCIEDCPRRQMVSSSSSITIKATARDKELAHPPMFIAQDVTTPAQSKGSSSSPLSSELFNLPGYTIGASNTGDTSHSIAATDPWPTEVDRVEPTDAFVDVLGAASSETIIQTHRFSITPRKLAVASNSRKKHIACELSCVRLVSVRRSMTSCIGAISLHRPQLILAVGCYERELQFGST